MKKLYPIKAIFAFVLLPSVFVIDGCKKEEVVKPVTTTTTATTASKTSSTNPVVAAPVKPSTPADYFTAYLGTVPVRFAGGAAFYSAYINPDSTQNQGGNDGNWGNNGNPDHPENGQTMNNSAYYVSGSKWVSFSSGGLQTTNASVELRSLAVRVFVSPVENPSSVYYNLIHVAAAYPVATPENPGNGAYVTLYDETGMLWTSAGDQDGSTLTINSVGANMGSYTVVSGTISCKMYDPHGNMQKLTGATFTTSLGI